MLNIVCVSLTLAVISKILKDKNKGAKPYNDTLFLIFIITHYMFICQVITNIL